MVSGAKLSRKPDQARLMLRGQATALVTNEKLVTTKARAKALVPYFERLITLARGQKLADFRRLRARLDTEVAARKLFNELVPRYADRAGGYTKLRPAGWRQGDNAQQWEISLTAAAKLAKKETQKPTTTTTKTAKIKTATK